MHKTASFGWSGLVFFALLLPCFTWGQEARYAGVPGPGPSASVPSSTPNPHLTEQSEPIPEQPTSLSGWFHILWEDPHSDSDQEPTIKYLLIDDQGEWVELLLDGELVRPFGGPLALNRKRVTVVGRMVGLSFQSLQTQPQSGQVVQVQSIELELPEGEQVFPSETYFQAVMGSQPWVTILCRFADSTNVTPHPKSWYETLMGSSYPGMDHYWQELSDGNINLTGSVVVGWYNLPQPRSYYVYDVNSDGKEDFDTRRATDDCTAVADADVFFPNFVGINLLFNYNLGCCAYGGSLTVTRDGQTKNYPFTWITLADESPGQGGSYPDQGVLAHEMGHGFGLPHSSGMYGQIYDSNWDVMSTSRNCGSLGLPPDLQYGCLGVHTISYHKDLLGWIPPARKYVATPGSSQTITMERLSQPLSDNNYLMAQIPIGGSMTHFYTIEARRFVGYDDKIPGEAIIIHKVDTTNIDPNNPLGNARAQVVDVDNNGNPNDAGAMWTPSEVFADPANGVMVSVDAATPTGFVVTITYGQPSIKAAFESPDPGPVSGVAVIRGWAFATQPGVQIDSAELFINGAFFGDIPCCSQRADVQAAFPGNPNALNSGWATTFNWGVLSAGSHTVQVVIKNTLGETLSTETRTVTVVKPGNFEFLALFSLSQATVLIEGEELILEDVVVRDKATQQQKVIDARFRWFTNSQSFGMVQTTTMAQFSSAQSLFASLWSSLLAGLKGLTTPAEAAPGIIAAFESPEANQIAAGVGVFRGWAFPDSPGASMTEVRLVIDETMDGTVPCCSARGDVAAAYPDTATALTSGWGAVFNYGVLSAGSHTLGVQLTDSTGATFLDSHGITVVKIGGFEFLDQLNLSGATTRLEGGEIVVEGVQVRDKMSQQGKIITMRLRWLQSAQALGIVASQG